MKLRGKVTYLHFSVGVITYFPIVAQTVKNPPAMQETWVQFLGQENRSGDRNGNPLQYSCLWNPMDRGAWWFTVHRAAKESDMTVTKNNNKKWLLVAWVPENKLSACSLYIISSWEIKKKKKGRANHCLHVCEEGCESLVGCYRWWPCIGKRNIKIILHVEYIFISISVKPTLLVIRFSSVPQSCPTLCNPLNRSTPGLPVHH